MPVAHVAESVKVVGEQTTNWLGAVIVGAIGKGFIAKFIVELAADVQPFKLQVAEME